MTQVAGIPVPLLWILLWLLALVITELLLRRSDRIHRRWMNIGRWLVVPYAALLTGGVSPRLMGLTMVDWPRSLSLGIAMVAGFSILFAAIRLTQGPGVAVTRAHPLFVIMAAGAEEFSWSFLRGAWWESLRIMDTTISLPAYWATWLAALVILPDLLLQTRHGASRITRLALLAASSALFIYTRNFWLCWILHAIVMLIFLQRTPKELSRPDKDQQHNRPGTAPSSH